MRGWRRVGRQTDGRIVKIVMRDNTTHYEQFTKIFQGSRGSAEGLIDDMRQQYGDDVPGAAAIVYYDKNLPSILENKFPGVSWEKKAQAMMPLTMALIDRIIERMLVAQEHPYSYGELARNIDYQRMFHYVSDNLVKGSFITQAVVITHILSHERAGKRVYQPSAGLAWQLRHTELRGLRTDDLRLPYENVYIVVPESANLQVYNAETGWHQAIGVYITEDPSPTENGGDPMGCRAWRVMVVGESKGVVPNNYGISEMDDALTYFRIPLPGGVTLDSALKSVGDEMFKEKEYVDGWEQMKDTWQNLFRWAMNAMLYATNTEKGDHWIANKQARRLWERIQKIPGKSKKKSRLARELSGIKNQQRRILLGTKVVIDRHVMKEGAPGGKGAPLIIRTRVSGHWRNQPYGKGREQRKLIFISPFWRGPEDGLISNPTHEMK